MSERILLGGGCFWCLEAAYQEIPGVIKVTSGYAGGTVENPTYEAVCSGATGHAEVVELEVDPGKLPLAKGSRYFFVWQDPTTPDRQGNDVGTQYRSYIGMTNESQLEVVGEAMRHAQENYANLVVTQIEPFSRFWPAEEYHQNYFKNHPEQPYCQLVVELKVAKARSLVSKQLMESDAGN